MSAAIYLSVLALASTALATPFAGQGHAHAHRHLHSASGSGSVISYPYKSANGTSRYGTTGTGYASPTGYGSETTLTSTSTGKTTMYTTVFVTLSAVPSGSGVAVGAADVSSGECGADITVTSTAKVTVTVTAGEKSSSSAASAVPYGSSSSSSSTASPVQSSSSAHSASAYTAPVSTSSSSSSAPAYTAPAYTAPSSSSSSVAAPVTTSSSEAPSSSAPVYTPSPESSSSSSVIAVLPSSYSLADKGSEVTATSLAAASYTSAASSTGGKRGLAYNDTTVDLLSCFADSTEISWAYNWVGTDLGMSGFKYIPTLHSDDVAFTATWAADAAAAIASGSQTIFSLNEPDIASQANLGVAAAVQAHTDNMKNFKNQAKICAPSVSNSGDPNQGLGYLEKFLEQCTGDDCPVDCLNIHWYATCDAQNFKDHIDSAVSMLTGDQTLYVSEFGVTDGSDADVASFLEDVMAYMDSHDKVAGYAYFMVADGILVSGSEPSSYGSTYKSYTG